MKYNLLILIGLLLIIPLLSNGKSKPKNHNLQGIVINSQNDTLELTFKIRTSEIDEFIELSQREFIAYDSLNNRTKILPDNFAKIEIEYNQKTYTYLAYETVRGLRFLNEVSNGLVVLLRHMDYPGNFRLIINATVLCWGRPVINYYLINSKTGKQIHINKKNYKTELSDFLNHDKRMSERIGNKDYKYKNVVDIINEFNNNTKHIE